MLYRQLDIWILGTTEAVPLIPFPRSLLFFSFTYTNSTPNLNHILTVTYTQQT